MTVKQPNAVHLKKKPKKQNKPLLSASLKKTIILPQINQGNIKTTDIKNLPNKHITD